MNVTDKIEQALKTLKNGGLIMIADDKNRESEGDLMGLGQLVSAENVNFMVQHARGLLCVPMASEVGQRLDLEPMVVHNTERFGTAFTKSVDHQTTTTGISAFDRAKTIQALADPQSQNKDFVQPGHIFPLIAKDGGIFERRGHTEAAVDLAKLAGAQPVAYICEILKSDGHMARYENLKARSKKWQIPLITIEELTTYRKSHQDTADLPKVQLPTAYGDFELQAYVTADGQQDLILSKGDLTKEEAPLIRVHSECLTGEVFGSHRCDCGEQLHQAMRTIQDRGCGAIIYLRQEGRGIGLLNKLRAYHLQEQGLDTYEANEALGFPADARHYEDAAEILQALHLKQIQLLTNNPDKIDALTKAGIQVVRRVPLETTVYPENKRYLLTKKVKFHHKLTLTEASK